MVVAQTKDSEGVRRGKLFGHVSQRIRAERENRSTKFDVLVRVHNFVVLRENVQKNEKSVYM